MSPVAPSTPRDARTVVIGVSGVVIAIVLLILVFVFALPSLTESGNVKVKLGSDTFDTGLTGKKAAEIIDRDGPILFSDVASGQNDIFLQHIGDDDSKGFLAFAARKPGSPRQCTLKWDSEDDQFNDPCDGSSVPADGAGLPPYSVTVTEDGTVVVRLSGEEPSTTTSSSSTTSSLPVTGTLPSR